MADDVKADEPAVVEDNEVQGELVENQPINFEEQESVETEASGEASTDEESDDQAGEEVQGETTESDGQEDTSAAAATTEQVESDEAGVYNPVTAEDPGDFKPGDYSFDIKTTDGQTHHISTPEEAQVLATKLDANPELMTASQFMVLNSKTILMEQGLANDRRDYDTNKAEFDRQAAQEQTRNETITRWNNELVYLTQKGDIPAVAAELNTAEAGAAWGTIHKDAPGVKERLELFKFMEEENDRRMGAGLEPLASMIDAYNQLQLEKIRNAERDTAQKETTVRRSRGSMVGGQTPYIPTTAKRNEIVGEGGSLNDVLMDFYNQ